MYKRQVLGVFGAVGASVSAATGVTTFSTVLSSSGGGAGLPVTVSVAITALSLAAGRSLGFVAAGYPSEGEATACGTAAGVDASKITVVQSTPEHETNRPATGTDCFFTVTALSSADSGVTTFTSVLTFSGGSSRTVTFSIDVGAASSITFTAPPGGLSIPAGQFRNFSVASYATDGDYTISCGYTDSSRHSLLASVANTSCDFTVRAGSSAGAATLSVIYYSSGGDQVTGVVPITVTPASSLTFTPPSAFNVRIGQTISVNARPYASDGANAVACDVATGVTGGITVQSPVGCSYRVTAGNTVGTASFVVPYASSSGRTLNGRIDINIVDTSSDIDFTAPTGLTVSTSGVITIDASGYVSDGSYSVSCGTITQSGGIFVSIFQDGCSFEVTSTATTGSVTFTVPYTSSGGDTHNGVISLVIGAVPVLAATGCTDGTFVDLTDNPRVTGANNDLVEDCQALVAAQNLWAGVAANGDLRSPYFIRSWGTGTPEQQKVARWEGVTVTSGRVTELAIDNTGEEDGISGTIPTELGNLTALTSLDISYNQLSGAIPTELGTLTALTSLDLSGNQLTGAIPTQIGSLTALTSLDLSGNQLSGDIPTQIGSLTSLTQLSLGSNRLSGDIPTQLGSLSALTDLYLGGNRLTGSVPTQIGTITTLTTFSICNNLLTGALPTPLRTGVTLIGYPTADGYNPIACQMVPRVITNAGASFTALTATECTDGTFVNIATSPRVAGNNNDLVEDCQALVVIQNHFSAIAANSNLSSTHGMRTWGTGATASEKLISTQGSGFFATNTWKGVTVSAGRVTALNLSAFTQGAVLSGTLPPELGNLTALTELYLDSNNFSGSIPTELGSLTSLTDLNISSNQLSGSIPSELGSLTSLSGSGFFGAGLNLSNNRLTGAIPTELGSLTSLRKLRLENNYLTGAIPIELGALTSLTELRLNNNWLEGAIPTQLTGLTSILSIYICTNYFTGAIPTSLRVRVRDTSSYNPIGCQRTSNITFTAPTGLTVNTSRSIEIDASGYVTDGKYAVSCGDATGRSANLTSVSRAANTCTFTITAGANTGTGTFTIPYSSSGGDTHNGEVSVAITTATGVSDITFTAPTTKPTVAASSSVVINAAAYASDGSYTISCGNATNVSSLLTSVNRVGCSFTVTAGSSTGDASFVVPYSSAGGTSVNGTINVTIGASSNIVFTSPTSLSIPADRSLSIDATDYATDGSYTFTCSDPVIRFDSSVDALASVTRSGCDYVVTPSGTVGSFSFSMTYTSSGGDTENGIFPVSITAATTVPFNFTPPDNFILASGASIIIDASSYASHGTHTISCGVATNVSNNLTVTQQRIPASGCSFSVYAGTVTFSRFGFVTGRTPAPAGTASFTVPYTSSGGGSHSGTVTVTIGVASDISFTAPSPSPSVEVNRRLVLDASSYATDGSYTISCGDATNVSTELTSVTRTADSCSFTITAGSSAGTGSFTIPYTSTGGDTHNGTVNITIAAATATSNIIFTAPPTIAVRSGVNHPLDLSSYATDATFTISCTGDASNISNSNIISVTRSSGCNYTVTGGSTLGTATFDVPYSSSGGDTHTGTFTVKVNARSVILYNAPVGLKVGTNQTVTINAADYASDGTYTITCENADQLSTNLTSVTREAGTCNYTITPLPRKA